MTKKILAIFFVSILLCSYIIPTTSAFADVVIGDNDSYAVTELGIENGKKIATMESMLQLLESGVSEINFNDISDLEDYLEEFYDELTNVNYTDVSNEILAGAYNDVKSLKQWIDDRGEYIATYYKDMLNSADQGLSDIFNNFQLKLNKTSLTGTPLNGFRGLSRFRGNNPIPQPSPDFSFIQNINSLYLPTNSDNDNSLMSYDGIYYNSQYGYQLNKAYNFNDLTICSDDFVTHQNHLSSANGSFSSYTYSIMTIYVTTISEDNIQVNYGDITSYFIASDRYGNGCGSINWYNLNESRANCGDLGYLNNHNTPKYNQTQFSGMSTCINYLYQHYCNINLYVDGVLWALSEASNVSTPTLDIDGFIKMFGNDNPIQYEFPQGTQIDYNALYTTIYNAIRDNLPLDMQTINNNQVYYDSHDTVYSPTIYNYYGKDGDDENDWIDSILDYATIPDFNSALGTVAVLDTPFVNGITIVNTGVTDVIPSDILLILGGFFVLVLFVCIINRMSE